MATLVQITPHHVINMDLLIRIVYDTTRQEWLYWFCGCTEPVIILEEEKEVLWGYLDHAMNHNAYYQSILWTDEDAEKKIERLQ